MTLYSNTSCWAKEKGHPQNVEYLFKVGTVVLMGHPIDELVKSLKELQP